MDDWKLTTREQSIALLILSLLSYLISFISHDLTVRIISVSIGVIISIYLAVKSFRGNTV